MCPFSPSYSVIHVYNDTQTGTAEVCEVDETASDPSPDTQFSYYNSPSPPPETVNPYNLPLPSTPGNLIDSIPECPNPYNVPLPGSALDTDLIDNAGAESEPRYGSSADGEQTVDVLVV